MKFRPKNMPDSAQILKGIGASSWFVITKEKQSYRIIRYSVNGEVECDSLFIISGEEDFDINKRFEFNYISHCKECTIIQNKKKIIFRRLE